MIYVLAGTYQQALYFAKHREISSNNLRYISELYQLLGIDGEGKTLYVYGTAMYRRDYADCIDVAKARRFTIEHVY